MAKDKIRKRKRIHEIDETNDMKFRGPLSYRHLRILGWLFLFLAQLGMIFTIASKAIPTSNLGPAGSVLQFFSSLMAPLFLIAGFSQTLVAQNGYKKMLFVYCGGAIGFFLLFLLVYFHFVLGMLDALFGVDQAGKEATAMVVQLISSGGLLSFNIFVDLALCALLTFFVNYTPTHHWQGNRLYIFRAFAILPILYEAGSVALKLLFINGIVTLHPVVWPLLTSKPPMAFFIFVSLALFIKIRERHFMRKGKTKEEYAKFCETNVNRFQFSLFLILAIVIAAVMDFFLALGISAAHYSSMVATFGQENSDVALSIEAVMAMGFGKTIPMILIIPILVFYDYRKTYTNKIVDTLIPAIGVALIILLYIEGMFQVARISISNTLHGSSSEEATSSTVSSALTRVINFIER